MAELPHHRQSLLVALSNLDFRYYQQLLDGSRSAAEGECSGNFPFSETEGLIIWMTFSAQLSNQALTVNEPIVFPILSTLNCCFLSRVKTRGFSETKPGRKESDMQHVFWHFLGFPRFFRCRLICFATTFCFLFTLCSYMFSLMGDSGYRVSLHSAYSREKLS